MTEIQNNSLDQPVPAARRKSRRTPPGSPPGMLVADPASPRPHLSIMAYGKDALEEKRDISLEDLDELKNRFPVLWLDVNGLGDVETLRAIGKRFGLHALALEDVVNVHQRPKVEEYDDHLFIVCRMPHTHRHLDTEQVSLFLGRNVVITFQERPGDCFEPVRNRLRAQRGRIRSEGPDYLTYTLLDAVTDAYFPVLETIGEQLDIVEEEIMSQPHPDDVKRIHRLKRDLLTVRRAIWPQREMLNTIIRDDSPLIRESTKV